MQIPFLIPPFPEEYLALDVDQQHEQDLMCEEETILPYPQDEDLD
jgi:hypothetical protein